MSWSSLANNQTISFSNLKDAVDTGVFSPKGNVPVSNEQITKAEADTFVWINPDFPSYAPKATFQLVVKSNLECAVPVVNTSGIRWGGIANNEETLDPIQLISGTTFTGGGRIYKSTNFGVNYFEVLVISDGLAGITYAPNYRHASYLSVTPFIAVGDDGRIVTNSVNDCSSWITISSPTSQDLYQASFNFIGTGVIVGDNRILLTDTDYRINSWSITNSVNADWRDVANDGFNFVAVGLDDSIITSNTALAVNWTVRSMPPLTAPGVNLYGVTYHTDGYFYSAGVTAAGTWFLMRSSDKGVNWTTYIPTDFTLFIGGLYSIKSLNGRLVIGGRNYQYQIKDGVVTRCAAKTGDVEVYWGDIVKDSNSTNGFDMVAGPFSNGAYSNF